MSEKSFWRTLSMNMAKCDGWREATRHEDKLQRGIADVSMVNNSGNHGWIELKKLGDWPKRESTIVRFPNYTDEQRLWLRRKGEAGGNTWLLAKVARDVLLFDYYAAQSVGYMNKKEMLISATASWIGKMNYEELGEKLCER